MQKDDLSDVTICEKCTLLSWLLVIGHLQSGKFKTQYVSICI